MLEILPPCGIPGLLGAGVIGIAGSVGKDYFFEDKINYPNAAIEGVTTVVLPVGVNKVFGQVVGREVSTFSRYFFTGSHTLREATVAGLQATLTYLAGVVQKHWCGNKRLKSIAR